MASTLVLTLALVVTMPGCAAYPGPHAGRPTASTPAAPPQAVPTDPSRPSSLIRPEDTAGLYWQPYVTCRACERPEALVAYVTPDAAIARTIVAALEGTLAFGLPYVIHTDQLGASPSGIAIITGTYGSRAAASAAVRRTNAIAGHTASVIPLVHDERGHPTHAPEQPKHVTVVDRGRSVPAWSRADLDAAYATVGAVSHETTAAYLQALRRALRERPPACMVEPGDLFVVEEAELAWYELAPVRCGKRLAYIDWSSSLHGHAVIVPDGTGHRLYQVVEVECDAPTIEHWRYGPDGRESSESSLLASAGCGPP